MAQILERIVRELQRDRLRLIAYIRAIVGDVDLAEDVFQEVSVAVLEKSEQFDPSRDFGSWSRGIARNIARRERARSRRMRALPDDRIPDLIDVAFEEYSEQEVWNERRTALKGCIGRLSSQARDMLQRRYVDGKTLRTIAGDLHRSEGAIQVALSRLRKSLSDCIARLSGQEAST